MIVAVMRGSELIIGHDQTRLAAGDEVLAVVHSDHLAHLAALLGESPTE